MRASFFTTEARRTRRPNEASGLPTGDTGLGREASGLPTSEVTGSSVDYIDGFVLQEDGSTYVRVLRLD